jgi:archaemetzincin
LDYRLDQLPSLMSCTVPNLEVRVALPVTDIGEAVDTGRGQYHSTRIIAILESHGSLAKFEKILGVTSVDLFNPSPRADGSSFIFGEARLRGRSGIVSTFRLSAGLPSSLLFNNRVKKEAFHELGHMMGLEHCPSLSCVMHKSENVDDTDAKSDHYCERCESILKELCR